MDEVHGVRDSSIVVEVCSSDCCSRKNVLMHVYFDTSRADGEGEELWGSRDKREGDKKICSLYTEAWLCLRLAVTQAATAHSNCDHFSIYISQLACALIFTPPSHQQCD